MSQSQSNSSRKILVILALSLFIIALILVIVSSMTPGTKRSITGGGNTFADGYKAARDQAARTGFPGILDPVMTLPGSVLESKNGMITIETSLFVNEKVDGVGTKRIITLAKDGKVVRRSQLDPAKIAEDMKAFQEKIKDSEPGESLVPPPMYKDEVISIGNVSVGDAVMVESDGSDLRLKDSIAASRIIVFAKPAEAVMPQ